MKRRPVPSLPLLALGALLMTQQPAAAQRLHYLGIAGDAKEAVFRSEVLNAGRAVASVWPVATSRVVGGSFKGGATYEAVRRSLRETAQGIDLERDVLFLLISSHSAGRGRGVELSGDGTMTPRMLRAALAEAGITKSIVIISACFSGEFVKALSGPNTAVITAASASNFAYGCLTRCRYTDFGEGFFRLGLAQAGRDLQRAFAIGDAAATAVARRHGLRPSRPQFVMGADIARTLQAVD
jgi:hypothetical protein